ncbi:uncharacterized protein C5orf34 homolog [Cololabis saira]|uniref:uncharacterized protein C5orf34 homolog n=1 Tax=Cololabis saira TaxID=129043 RepID=UPI002AD3CC41|nr:uncharacterized protein C5orf34 homolog [Cololabis saira]
MDFNVLSGVSLMIMYEDESVDVHYKDGTRLQLSPCGCEFMFVKAADPNEHPLQPAGSCRHRTRFTVSSFKDLVVTALGFRNKFASRPYLPEELISTDHKKPFFSIECGVLWPERSSYEAEFRAGGEVVVRSEDGRALLMLSPSGEEFSVEFICSLSQSQNQHHSMQCLSNDPDGSPENQKQHLDGQVKDVHHWGGSRRKESTRSTQSAPQEKPEQMYQSTIVNQLHSCCAVAPTWVYPLSLARHQWTSHLSESVLVGSTSNSGPADSRINISDIACEERKSQLPHALPLTCPSPHSHRWKFKDPLAGEEVSDTPGDVAKIVWCQGLTYRILGGAVPVIEISPGDGSVIRSNGVLNSYFTHYKPEHQSKQVKVLTYHLSSLPPDVLGQVYSVRAILSRASRILSCYTQAKQLLKLPTTPSCLQEDKHSSKSAASEQNPSNTVVVDEHMNATRRADSQFSFRSDLVAAELEKIKRFNFLLENNHLIRRKDEHADLERSSAEVTHDEPINEDHIAGALRRTSKAIQDIDFLTSAAKLT